MKLIALSSRSLFVAMLSIIALYYSVKLYQYIDKLRSDQVSLIKAFADADISIHTPIKCNQITPGNIWLISYADGESYIANQNALFASSINKCIDTMRIYRKKDIDPSYYDAHKFILTQKRGAGYWMWKPYLILKTLNEMPENDILIYVDSGATIIKSLDSLVDNFLTKDIILFDQKIPNKPWTRRMLFQMMDMDNEEVHNCFQRQAGFITIRNTKNARDIIAKWLYWAEKPEAITDEPLIDEYPEFIDHRHDQSILSLLSLKHKDDIKIVSSQFVNEYFFLHRRQGFSERSLIFPNQVLSDFQSWLSKAAYKTQVKGFNFNNAL